MRATKIEVAKSYVRANPNTPHRTIAKIMNNDRPDLWRTVELARAAVRSVVGQNGKLNRAILSKDCYKGDALSKLERELSSVPAGIPAELRTELTPYTIQPGDKWGIMGDVHIPVHSKLAVETAVRFLRKRGHKNLLFLGDAVEHSRTSRFSHDPNDPDIYGELKAFTAFLKYVREMFKGEITFKAGNHEVNLAKYVQDNAPALASLPCLQFDQLVGFNRYGINYVGDKTKIEMGYMNFIHGHEYKGGSVLNPASWLLRKARSCCATLHWHRADTARGKTVRGVQLSTWSVGCLCNLSPDWCSSNEWCWGCADIETEMNGNFRFSNHLILGRDEVVPA